MKRLGRMLLLGFVLSVVVVGASVLCASAASPSELSGLSANVTDVTADSQAVAVNSPVRITVLTDSRATCVRLDDAGGTVLGEKTSGAVSQGDQLAWSFDVIPSSVGSKIYTAHAGTGYGYTSSKTVSIAVGEKPELSNLKVINLALYCDVSHCASQADAVLEVRDADGNVLYSDYQKEKLPLGSYTVRAKIRNDEAGLWSDPAGITVTEDKVVLSQAINLIVGNEGGYASVNKNDYGALSIGRLQWHATRAHDLLNRIKKADEQQAQKLLAGTSIYQELNQPASTWNTRVLNSEEAKAVSALISTDIGKRMQDDQAETDVSSYISSGRYRGFTTPGALIYYADLYNQGPAYAIDIAKRMKTKGLEMNLDNLHQESLADQVMGKYPSRRNSTYNNIRKLGYYN
ncbi:MAG: hypothetical protein HFE85_01310 [Clostridiales bacterium]|nr:hypothetical protein [Clostridiales bacterium]